MTLQCAAFQALIEQMDWSQEELLCTHVCDLRTASKLMTCVMQLWRLLTATNMFVLYLRPHRGTLLVCVNKT